MDMWQGVVVMWQGLGACGRGGGMWQGVGACDKAYGYLAGGVVGTCGRGWGHVAGCGVM